MIAYLLLFLIGYLDYLTGVELSSSVVYFFPIFLVASNRQTKRIDCILIAFFCSLSWLSFELLSSHVYSNPAFLFWNAFVRAVTFFLISLILYRLRENRQRVEMMNQELEAANTEKNKFIGIAAHDIRNPLANIYNISVLLNSGNNLSPKQQQLVALLKRISADALTLLTNLLDISQIEAGAVRLKKQKQDYVAFVKEQIMLNSHLAEKKNQHIAFVCRSAELQLPFDSSYMGQVISNLLSNAIKYSLPDTTIEVGVEEEPSFIKTSFKDQGSGIRPQDLEKIFRPFGKGVNRPTAGESSTGLGLTIVKKLVEAHGGEVGVESTYEKGATFCYTLPIEEQV